MSRISSLRSVLRRAEVHLEDPECADDTAAQLLCAVKALSLELTPIEAEAGDADPRAPELLERGLALLEQVHGYAETTRRSWFRVATPAPRPDDTETRMLTSEEIYLLAHGMKPGLNEPPAAVREAAEEAQAVGRYSTTPSPPPVFDDEPHYTTKPGGAR